MFGAALSAVLSLVMGNLPQGINKGFVDDLDGNLMYRTTPEIVFLLRELFPNAHNHGKKYYWSIEISPQEWNWVLNNVHLIFYIQPNPYGHKIVEMRDIRDSFWGSTPEEKMQMLDNLIDAENQTGIQYLLTPYNFAREQLQNIQLQNEKRMNETGTLEEITSAGQVQTGGDTIAGFPKQQVFIIVGALLAYFLIFKR